jgi:starvation-inducible DNA-binding protein
MAIISLKPSDEINSGLDKKARQSIATVTSVLLSNTYMLQLKTQYYHWNVTGPHFIQLHELFGAQYSLISAAVDEIAERIRALGFVTPGTFREFSEISSLKEDKSPPANWQGMVKNLVESHEAIVRHIRDNIAVIQKHGDEGTADVFIGRQQEHEKMAWMLRSHLAK